jgi:hypothetical protein
MARYETVTEATGKRGRAEIYRVATPAYMVKPLYVIGPYENACGGCDAIQPYSEIWPRVEKYAEEGHVIFEGVLISTNYGTIGTSSEKYGRDFVFAFLNTPLDICLERIKARRLARGNTKPLNPYQTEWKHKAINKLVAKFTERGRRCVVLDYRKAVAQVLGLLVHA